MMMLQWLLDDFQPSMPWPVVEYVHVIHFDFEPPTE